MKNNIDWIAWLKKQDQNRGKVNNGTGPVSGRDKRNKALNGPALLEDSIRQNSTRKKKRNGAVAPWEDTQNPYHGNMNPDDSPYQRAINGTLGPNSLDEPGNPPYGGQEKRTGGRKYNQEKFNSYDAGNANTFYIPEAGESDLTVEEKILRETLISVLDQMEQEERKRSNHTAAVTNDMAQDTKAAVNSVPADNTVTDTISDGDGKKSASGTAGQDIEVRSTNLSHGNEVYYDNTTGDITIVTDEGYKMVLKKNKDYYIKDNKAYYINDPSMAVASSAGQDKN